MRCPRCEERVLEERERDGIMIDGCPTCRGIWLDRGELEKLLAREAVRVEEERLWRPASRASQAPREGLHGRTEEERRPPRDDESWDGPPPAEFERHRQRRKKGWLEGLGDLFG
jgi:Zn-finger nucleic acid-binding protein